MTTANHESRQYPAAMVNITNKCNLRRKHCFVFQGSNPTSTQNELPTEQMLERLSFLQKKHSIQTMLWMGGEPLLRPDVLEHRDQIIF